MEKESAERGLCEAGSRKGFENGRGILSEADCYVSETPRYLSEASG